MSWDDLRYVLAVADQGSLNAAARVLGVTHATVLRRVAAFEAAHGGAVFERDATGYRVAEGRGQVIEAAREVADAMRSVDRIMHGAQSPPQGLVRISSTDSFCQRILPGFVAHMAQIAPELDLELLSANHYVDLGRLQADLTVRPTTALPEDMSGDVAASLAFGAYARTDAPQSWLALQGTLARSAPARWMKDNVPASQIAGSADSFLVLAELASQGLGIAAMPCFLGDGMAGLQRLPEALPAMSVPVWVATHVDLREAPRIRQARLRLRAFLESCADRLAGKDAP